MPGGAGTGADRDGGPAVRRAGSARAAFALVVTAALLGPPRAAGAVEEDTVGWWIYAGSVRSTLLSRFIGPEGPNGMTPEQVAIARAGRACGLIARVDARDVFAETPPGAAPVVFGPFLSRTQVAASLACIRRAVPSAFVTQARPPA
ncbi:hypothetical protein [Methylobacterium sp. J-070]|uniref:hypothetical protein n=1 Tax=Methylobacterium sp. J-070 TaxID=2836650 RepID=UPI001FB975D2|nr:hypothetical protein [Methylobacterium sp. J-070]MCJ2048658.1 hypothetical protein [Methylobacterium sp. J-070]